MFKNFTQNLALKYAHNKIKNALYKNFNININQDEIKKIPDENHTYMLYAHIPFCHQFCTYCSFHKYQYEPELCKKYFSNLRDELRYIKDCGYKFEDMYVGGGTTLIDEEELYQTLKLAKDLFGIKKISIESDPSHINPDDLKNFSGLVDRLSIGVQSFSDEILKKTGRFAKFGGGDEIFKKIEAIKGILPVISVDLIFNLPDQSKDDLIKDIEMVKRLKPEQVTFYPLMISDLTKENISKSLGTHKINNERYFYEIIKEQMSEFSQSNAWAWNCKKCKLNDEYVGSNAQYLGVGSGAFSYLDNRLLINAFNLNDYENFIKNKKSPVIGNCDFKKVDRINYAFLTNLFDLKIDIQKFNQIHKCDLKADLGASINMLKFVDAIYEENNVIYPTEFGKYLAVTLMKDFYTGMDRIRKVFRDDEKIKNSKMVDIK